MTSSTHRQSHLDALAANPATVEKDIHKAIENSLWVLGGRYALMASNTTLRRVVVEYCKKTYTGERAAKRPDLLLAADASERYLLIEFKRPSHVVTREGEAQARVYRDELSPYVPGKAIDIIVIAAAAAINRWTAATTHRTCARSRITM